MKIQYCKYIPCHKKELKLNYYWYHHGMLSDDFKEEIEQIIKNHDYDSFISIKRMLDKLYDFCFLPDIAFVCDENDEYDFEEVNILNRENFNKIVYEEYECG